MDTTFVDIQINNNMKEKTRKEADSWKPPGSSGILHAFSQETSFHGLRQIGEDQPFAMRRLIWVLIFIGGASIFVIQMTTSIELYLKWPVSVDVKINYNESILFPAVTICNSNAFSATKAYERGYYSLIDELFGPEKFADLEKYNASAMSLLDLYEDFGHSKTNMIVSCQWNGHECTEHDFTAVLTDYGRCFTFNSGKDEKPLKETQEPGADGGLKVQLNIEQYKYMRGPHQGAGLRVLVHNHNDVPLVRDYGLAVSPGSQAFVAVKVVEVNNLEPDHGKCNKSASTTAKGVYTVSRCNIECKMEYLYHQCGCRDIYMENLYEPTRICSIDAYQTCGRDALNEYNMATDICECPIPCHRLLYEPIISYSSASNFDIDALLRKTKSGMLEEEYIAGREITQRVNTDIAQDNVAITKELNLTVKTLSQALTDVKSVTQNLTSIVKDWQEELDHRINFHLDRGLKGVEYIVKHDFVRGFDVFFERAFHYVTQDFMGFPLTVKRTWERARERLNVNDTQTKELAMLSVVEMIASRSELLNRAADWFSDVKEAYLTGKPLLTYKFTYARRYDMSYIHVPLLQIESSRLETNYDEMIEAIDRMHLGLNLLTDVNNEILKTGIFNESTFNYGEDRYLSGGRQYNYRMFQFTSKVITAPLEEIERRIEQFEIAKYSLHENIQATFACIDRLIASLDTLMSGTWKDLVSVSELLSLYLTDWDVLKTPISKIITSKETEDSVRSVSILFNEIKLRVSVLQDHILTMKSSVISIVTLMLSEDSVKEVYRMLYEDCQDFVETDENDELYVKIFAYMLRTSQTDIKNLTHEQIISRMNCDFHVLNISAAIENITRKFSEMEAAVNLAKGIGELDELFLEMFRQISEEHKEFIADSKIDSSFYKENFLTLQVFMQEMRYEEVNQQSAYDLTQLLSDIGGSMGLFIGGSLLSIFEFFDAIIHRGLRMALNR